ncbi:MAG: class I SAM-dependent methyltransferase [Lachnospiraceae bacterium]|nr:class I SAM-dependent methyltransferase [Lachnospiraceae bacterium]
MDIIIWGTGERGKRLKHICEMQKWNIKAFVDNNDSLWGKKIDDIDIIPPTQVSELGLGDTCLWIASGAKEIYSQARSICRNILPVEVVDLIIRGGGTRAVWPEVELSNDNICDCRLLTDRIELLKKFSDISVNWKMAEIGVAFGDYSMQILKICNPARLFLIDAWESERYEKGLQEIKNKFALELNQGKVKLCRGYSLEQLEMFADGELDWVYIDTVHDYDTTRKELELCARKVSRAGYICGHDYTKYNVQSRLDYGVYDAVNEFAAIYGYEFIYLTMEANGLHSFALKKNL